MTTSPVPSELCAFSKREDGQHTWNFDGDDPYVICAFCDRMQDARTGRVIRPGREFKETAENLNVATDVQDDLNPAPVPSDTDRLAEALDCVEEALTAPWEPAFVHGTTGSEALQQVRAEVASLQARLTAAEGQLAKIREHQIGLARGFLHDAEEQRKRAKRLDDRNLTHAEGTAHGAITALQVLLVETGEVEYDEEADAVWDLVARKDGETPARALDLGEGDEEARRG